jgi:predicted small secreted protein
MNRLIAVFEAVRRRWLGAALLLLPIVIAACNNNGSGGPGY